MTGDQTPPAGWYPDEGVDAPAGQQRYWDGSAWTEHTTAPTLPSYQTAVQQAPRNGLGLAALILGVIGVVAGLIPFLYWFTGIIGILGLILGFIGRGRAKRGEATNGTVALWGIITAHLSTGGPAARPCTSRRMFSDCESADKVAVRPMPFSLAG